MNEEFLIRSFQEIITHNDPAKAQRVILLMIQYKKPKGKFPFLQLDEHQVKKFYLLNAARLMNNFLANPTPENFALAVAEIASSSVWGWGKKF